MRMKHQMDVDAAMKINRKALIDFRWMGDALAQLLEKNGVTQGVLAEAVGAYLATMGMYAKDDERFYVEREDARRAIKLVRDDLLGAEANL